jgi:glucose-1-phosphate adenylyltransferase
MDYDMLLDFHIEKGAEATICTIRVPMDEGSRYGILDVDKQMRVTSFVEKPQKPPSDLASMGVYIFTASALEKLLAEDADRADSSHDFGKDIIPRMIAANRAVYAYPFEGYWIDVGTIDAYWEAHMDLLAEPPSLNLNDRAWIVHTRSEERPPVLLKNNAIIKDSLITDGSIICDGATVERSVLSPNVYVGPRAVIRESVILTDSYIEADAVIERCIIDKQVVIERGAQVGKWQEVGEWGITVVGKNTRIPAGFTVGRNVVLGTDLTYEDFAEFANRTIPNGKKVTVEKKRLV